MADTYDVIAAERVPVTLADGRVVDGQDSTIKVKASGVVFHVVIVVNQATFEDPARLAAAVDGVARPYAAYFDHDVTVPGVVDLSTYQDFDDANNAVTVLRVTVASSTDSFVQTTREAPFTTAIPDRFEPFVAQTRASLDALAG